MVDSKFPFIGCILFFFFFTFLRKPAIAFVKTLFLIFFLQSVGYTRAGDAVIVTGLRALRDARTVDGNWDPKAMNVCPSGFGWNVRDVLLRDMVMAVYVLAKLGGYLGEFQVSDCGGVRTSWRLESVGDLIVT